ncbi:MAG: band 7 protein [Propionibacterium sp.]|nr:MAG: band 7 protein [Propionibacterium sp.]
MPIPAVTPPAQQVTNAPVNEVPAKTFNGWLALIGGIVLLLLASPLALLSMGMLATDMTFFGFVVGLLSAVLGIAGLGLLGSLTIIAPGQTRVVQFFGKYIGTIRQHGMVARLPFSSARRVSIKANSFETNELKVNDANGNPINIAAIVVWQVADTAKAVYEVESYGDFVYTQAESALRHVAMSYPYDAKDPSIESLRGATDSVSDELAREVADRISLAGMQVLEVRISSLAYAPEIAQAMLQRQQAAAIIDAREQIVEGAVTMVQGALDRLEKEDIVRLDEERKAKMISNLLVVLCSESRTTPVVNAGSEYH